MMETINRPLPPEIWHTLHPAAQAKLLEPAERIAALERQLAAVHTERLAPLEIEMAALQARLRELEVRLGQNSRNSSRPPSSDLAKPPRRRPPGPSGRQPGGQPGHEPHQRALLPPDQVDAVVEHWPERCAHCQTALGAATAPEEEEPDLERHQVLELPPLRATVTEHRLHRRRCPACGQSTRAGLPADVPRGAFGPRLQAAVALLSGRYRLSRRETAAVCEDLLGAPLGVASVDGLCQETAAALAAPQAQLEQALPQADVAHADETSWREAGQKRWLWVVVGAALTVFRIAQGRGSAVIKGLLGEDFAGWLVTDRWSAYNWLPVEQRQLCWAHLLRHFQAVVDANRAGRPLAQGVLAVMSDLFALWHQARDRPELRDWLREQAAPLQADIRLLLEAGLEARDPKLPGLCEDLLGRWPALWTFLTVPGVEPTNNRAEQALRPAVLWRKGSFGTQCEAGNHFVERMLSVTATCKQQGRPLLEYLTAVCTAAQQGQPVPLLLPSPSAQGA